MVNIQTVIYGVIALVVIGALAGVGITAINDTNTTGWSDAQVALFVLLPTMFVIGLLIAFIPKIGKNK